MDSDEDSIWVAADCSYSVNKNLLYFSELAEVLGFEPPATSYFKWDCAVEKMTFPEMQFWVSSMKGFGGTSPSEMAKYISEKSFHGVLRLITDGEVSGDEVQACDEYLHGSSLSEGRIGHIFKMVQVWVVGKKVNASVVLPFTRFSPCELKFVDADEQCPTIESICLEDIKLFETFDDFLKQQGTGEDFEKKAERLKNVARNRFMGTTGSARVRDIAIQAKNHLTREMSDRLGHDVGERLMRMLENRSDGAVEVAKEIFSDFLALKKGTTPAIKTLDAIIGFCDGIARNCFSKADAEKAISTSLQRATLVPEPAETLPLADPQEEDLHSVESVWFQCSVMFTNSTSSLMLLMACPRGHEGKNFIETLEDDDDFRKKLASNPLFLWTREDYVDRFASMFDDLLSCEALRHAQDVGAPIVTSPTTRRPLVAAFPVSSESEDHVKVRRWALSKVISGGKRWGNPEIWFVNLVLVVFRKRVCEKLQQALPVLLSTLKAQLVSVKTFASLSGLPELPVTKVPTSAAFWLVAAGAVCNYPPISLQLLPVIPEVLWVVQNVMEYRLPLNAEVELSRLQIVQDMREWKLGKKPFGVPSSKFDGPERLDNVLLAFSQKCFCITTENTAQRLPHRFKLVEFIPVDGSADDNQRRHAITLLPNSFKEHIQKHGWKDLVHLAKFVDVSKKASECVPPTMSPLGLEKVLVEWKYGLNEYERSVVPICHLTGRPFSFVIGQGDDVKIQSWKDAAQTFYGFSDDNSMISVHESFGNFVTEMRFYPSEEEMALYLWHKWVVSGKKKTLPHLLHQFISEVLESVAPMISEIDPLVFVDRFNASRPCEERRRLETIAPSGDV
jgi:hypothetical protein